MEAEPEQMAAFAQALQDALAAQSLEKKDLANMIGVLPASVSQWASAVHEPPRQKVFAMEEALGLPPGSLSQCLGYLPTTARSVVTVPDAIDADPSLTPQGRRWLKVLYQEAQRR